MVADAGIRLFIADLHLSTAARLKRKLSGNFRRDEKLLITGVSRSLTGGDGGK
jgi:hypothetical protein